MINRRPKMTTIRLLTTLVLLVFTSAISWAESAPAKHLGVASCASSTCHGRALPADSGNIAQNEYRIWAKYDHHSRAYAILKNKHSQRIAANMGIADAATEPACLACHADTTPTPLQGEKFHIEDGIGCEVCHGGAENWIDSHYGAKASHQQNLQDGMLPTEQPYRVAELCQSCHLGNNNQLATHEMMAAGHPRLRFELDTWLALMPPHHVSDTDYQQRGKSSSTLARWLAGRIQAAKDYLALLEKHSAGQGLFPELAMFDCHACHRPMDVNVQRSNTDKQFLPAGSIRVNDNSLRILSAIVSVRDPKLGGQFTGAIRQLHQASALSARELQKSSRQFGALLKNAELQMRESELSLAEQKLVSLALLRQAAEGDFRDYADAEQLFLGLQLLAFNQPQAQQKAKLYDEIFTLLDDEKNYSASKFKHAAENALNTATTR